MKSALFIILTDNAGGAERIAITLANRLSERPGWRVELLVMSKRSESSFVDGAAKPTVVRRFGCFARERLSFTTLPFRLVGRRYDLVFTTHVHTNALTSLMSAIGLLRCDRLVSRESTTVFDRFTGFRIFVFRCFYQLYGAQTLIVAQTQCMADHVIPRLPQRARPAVRVMPNPIDLNACDQASQQPLLDDLAARLEQRPSILFCGRLIEVKQPFLALEAFSILIETTGRDMQLVFLGDGPLRTGIEAAVAARGMKDRVIFLGRQTNPYPIMRACKYGILTSSREGFPNVVLEMMACGIRKMVVTPCAGDLDKLAGVTVTSGFSAVELATAMGNAIVESEDLSDVYRQVASTRSVDPYLDAIIGLGADET